MPKQGSQSQTRSQRPGSPLPDRPRELLKTCETDLTRHLFTYLRPAFEETNDELFDEAHKSGSTQAQNRLFEAMNELKSKRTAFSDALAEEIANHFQAFINAKPSAGEDDDSETTELSLVEDHDLAEDLAITQIVSKAEIRNTQALYALNQRLAVLNRGRAVKNNSNPLGPFKIGAALRNAADCLDVAASDKVKLFHAFDRQLQQHLGTCYSELNQKLIEEGILPNLKLDVRKKSAAPAPPKSRPDTPEGDPQAAPDAAQPEYEQGYPGGDSAGGYPASGAQPAPGYGPADGAPAHGPAGTPGGPEAPGAGGDYAPPPLDLDFFGRATGRSIGTPAGSRVDAELVRDIRKLLARVAPPGSIPRNAVAAETTRLQQALSGLQTRLAQPSADMPDLLSADQVKKLLSETLGRDQQSGRNLTLSDHHSQTIDIVGMLYDHIKQEDLLHEPVQQLLKRLQVPMIRVALEEDEFFDDTQHPARRLFNTIADAGELWLDDKPEGSATFQKMQIAVDRILGEYQDDLDVFKNLLGDLDKHIATLSRKAQVTERRAVEKLRGQEKLELARDRARKEMDRLIEKYSPPRFVESVLEHPWTDFLALTSLRYGVDDDHWKEALSAAKTLIFSVRQDLTEEVKAKLRQRIPWLRKKLTEGLSQVGYFEQDIDVVLGNLETCHSWSLAKTEEARPAQERAPERAPEPKPREAEPAPAKAAAASKPKTAPPAEPEAAEPAAAERPREPAQAKAAEPPTPVEEPAEEAAPPAPAEPTHAEPAAADSEWEELDLKEVALSGLAEKERAAAAKAPEPVVAEAPAPEVLNQPIPKSGAQKETAMGSLKKRRAELPPLNAGQKAALAQIRLLAFGTWFEIRMEGQGPWVKRKLSWYSPMTGRCLFVNNRGAMAEEMNMHELAIAMADGRARTYEPQTKPLIDRAFQSIFKHLRGLVDRVAPA